MNMPILKSCLVLATGAGVLDAVPNEFVWEKAGIIGVLAVALVVVWKEGIRHQTKLETIIESNTAAVTKNAEAVAAIKAAVADMTVAVHKCAGPSPARIHRRKDDPE